MARRGAVRGAETNMAATSRLLRRRFVYWSAVALVWLAALLAMARVLGADGTGPADLVLLACFAGMLPWNVIGFCNAAVGFALLRFARDPVELALPAASVRANPPIRSRLAIVMPVHNENPARVVDHLERTVASLVATREPVDFEVFLLSDTQLPETAAAELAEFERWRARSDRSGRLHYRRRAENVDHKTGNIWEFLTSRGALFDLMLVLDADSIMTGDAIVRLARIMERQPRLGILQQLIVGLPNLSPFARIFQFGMRHGMRAYTIGSAWWQGDSGPYWGHNALIRIAPFMAHCRLPVLPGGPPLGGRMLSHDQAEAVLMRSAGWEVRVLPCEQGSFEENPPTLPDFAKRDLRWCQGNWQYLRFIGWPGIHAMGRLQLGLAILMYVSGPAWILFSLVAFGRASAARWLPPGGESLPGWLGVPALWEPWALLAATMTLVFAPKLAGVTHVLLSSRLRPSYGGGPRIALSSLLELLFSFSLAPILAVSQTIFALGLLGGRAVHWKEQERDSRALPWREAARGLWPHTLLGLLVGVVVWLLGPAASRIWLVLFCAPLVLAVPFAVLTSWTGIGLWLARLGICATPEEIAPHDVVAAAGRVLPPAARRDGTAPGLPEAARAAPPVD